MNGLCKCETPETSQIQIQTECQKLRIMDELVTRVVYAIRIKDGAYLKSPQILTGCENEGWFSRMNDYLLITSNTDKGSAT